MQSFHNLRVTAYARQLNVVVYCLTRNFPPDERFGLVAQMRRASMSIGAHIAEGCGREGDRALVAFLHIAMGSVNEPEFEALAASDLGFLSPEEYGEIGEAILHVKRPRSKLIAELRKQDVRSVMQRNGRAPMPVERTDRHQGDR